MPYDLFFLMRFHKSKGRINEYFAVIKNVKQSLLIYQITTTIKIVIY